MNVVRWVKDHSNKLIGLHDTPSAIAGGVAIGLFWSFTPLLGLKTVLSIAICWLTGCNIVASLVALALHDLAFPLMPLVYRWEYDFGYWLLSQPHQWPPKLSHEALTVHGWWNWQTFVRVGKPLFVGSILVGLPFSVLSFLITWWVLDRHRRRKHLPPYADPESP